MLTKIANIATMSGDMLVKATLFGNIRKMGVNFNHVYSSPRHHIIYILSISYISETTL